ncbi:MAG TPA: type II secretion system protein GspM [Gammaproteobacteria bacterium]|jgi:hypothetical protein|nr:type II secretion system protein GspM [Gammaproteobacteria bacterium]
MNIIFIQFKEWYNTCKTRERILAIFLGWSILYGFFYFFLFKSLDREADLLNADIRNIHHQIKSWDAQIDALNKLSTTPTYKKWLVENAALNKLRTQYKRFLTTSAANQWQDVIKQILSHYPNIKLEQIKNMPESLYQPENINDTNIYQQTLILTFDSNYIDTFNYIQQLESALPQVHWDTLSYEVTQYPLAKIEMEISILYDKGT